MKNFQLQHRPSRPSKRNTPQTRSYPSTHASLFSYSRRNDTIFDSEKKKDPCKTHAKDQLRVEIRFPRNVDNEGNRVNFFSPLKISGITIPCASSVQAISDNRVKIREGSHGIRIKDPQPQTVVHNKDEATCVRVRGYACAKFHTNWLERVWTRTNENERGCDERKRVCVCVGEGGGELAWWRDNVCERNAAKKSGHVCRQQINENKVAWSSYSGAERSASIYTTQGSDLIWETDLHPRWRGRGKGNDAKEEEEEGEEGRKERGWWEWRQPRGREGQDGRATEERGYTGVYSRIHSPARLFPSAESNGIESAGGQ